MLKISEMANKFDISKSTLYDWKTDRPKIYDYLVHSDEQYEKYRKVNILLEDYIKSTVINTFSYDEIEFVLNLKLNLADSFEVNDIHLLYSEATQKIKQLNSDFTLNISYKLSSLNLLEKYIFCERLETITKKLKPKSDEKADLIQHYFKEFLEIK
jgi:hypothetical protein